MTWRECKTATCAAEMGTLPPTEFTLAPHRGVCDACIRESGIRKISTRCADCGKGVKASVGGVGRPRCANCAPKDARRPVRTA